MVAGDGQRWPEGGGVVSAGEGGEERRGVKRESGEERNERRERKRVSFGYL